MSEKILYVDDREPPSVGEILAQNCTIPIIYKRLDTADFVCEDVYVERKTINDFAISIMDKRLFEQVERLTQLPNSYLLISGLLKDMTVNIYPHAILGAIAKIASKGVTVVQVEDEEKLFYLLLKIFEHHGKLKLNKTFKYNINNNTS